MIIVSMTSPPHQLPRRLLLPHVLTGFRDLTHEIQVTIPMRSVIFISYLVFVAQSVFESLQHEDLMRVRHQGNALGHDASVVPCMNGKHIEGILNGSSMEGVLNRAAVDKKPNTPGGPSLTLEWKASSALLTTADRYASDLFDKEEMDKLFEGNSLLLDHRRCLGSEAETGEKKRYSRRKSTPLNSTSRTGGLDSNVKEDTNGLGASISDRSASDCTSSLAGDSEPSSSPKAHMGRRISRNTVLYSLSDPISTAAAPKDTNVDPNIARDELLREQLKPPDDEYCRAVRLILVEKGKRFKCGMDNDIYHTVRQDENRHNFFPK